MDRISAMTTFVRVVEAGSFTRAADSLDMPKGSVTRLIQGLEADLQVRLLQRSTRSVSVTAEGAVYYERIVRLLADLQDIEAGARQSQANPSGRIRVEAAPAIGAMMIVPALPAFYEKYPGIELELSLGNRTADLISENIDCAIRAGVVTDQAVAARIVGASTFPTCASPAYLATRGVPGSPEELLEQGHHTIGLVGSNGKPLPFRFRTSAPIEAEEPPRPSHRLLVNDGNAYVAAARSGLGIIQAPSYSVRSALEAGELVAILPKFQPDPTPISVIYPPNRFLSAKIRVFIDWVATLFEADPALHRR